MWSGPWSSNKAFEKICGKPAVTPDLPSPDAAKKTDMKDMKKNTARAILMCAGEYEEMEILRRAEDLVIAVDGGLPRLLAQGMGPDLILGDFDSLGKDMFPFLEQAERGGEKKVLRLPVEKDDTDTIYAAKLCLEQGYRDFLIYGALGGRLDHTMANIQTLAWLKDRGARAFLVGKRTLVSVLRSEKLTFPEDFEGIFSLFALDQRVTGVTLEGMKYPLRDAELTNSFPLGVSNEISPEISSEISRGISSEVSCKISSEISSQALSEISSQTSSEISGGISSGNSGGFSSGGSSSQRASVTVREGKALMILTKSRGDFSAFDPEMFLRQTMDI